MNTFWYSFELQMLWQAAGGHKTRCDINMVASQHIGRTVCLHNCVVVNLFVVVVVVVVAVACDDIYREGLAVVPCIYVHSLLMAEEMRYEFTSEMICQLISVSSCD